MVAPKLRKQKRVFRKSPGGKRVILYRKKKTAKRRCDLCGTLLHGIPHGTLSGIRKIPKTRKRPERLFGGVLCGRCVARVVKEKTRLKTGLIKEEEIPLTRLKYIEALGQPR